MWDNLVSWQSRWQAFAGIKDGHLGIVTLIAPSDVASKL
jgi:hypothetical protein